MDMHTDKYTGVTVMGSVTAELKESRLAQISLRHKKYKREKAAKQNTVTQAITQVTTEAAKAAIVAVKKSENLLNAAKSVQGMFRTGGQH